jgi:hypothetical protein
MVAPAWTTRAANASFVATVPSRAMNCQRSANDYRMRSILDYIRE